MYCPNCGTANDDSAAFCANCGFDLAAHKEQWREPGSEATPGAQPPAAGQPPAGQPSAYPPPYQQQYQPTYQTPPYQAGAPYQPAAYQPAGYQPGYGAVPHISSYLGWAIATLILCFWPTGIVAVVYAAKVGNRLSLGDVPGAQEASRKAKMWTWITFGIGVAFWVIGIIVAVIAAATAVNTLNVY
jgi:hypothetical protein